MEEKKEEKQLGRVRASFGFLIGGLALVAGIGLRFLPEIDGGWAASAFAFALAAVLSAWLARPREDPFIELGLLPVSGVLGLLMGAFALMEESARGTLTPAGLECAGAFTLLVSAIRFIKAQSMRALPKFELEKKRKVTLRRDTSSKRPEVPIPALVKDDEVELKSGVDIPADGIVLSGSGFVDERLVFGTALPAAKKEGDPLFAGTHASIPDLALQVAKAAEESLIYQKERLASYVASDLLHAGRGARISAYLIVLLGLAGVGFSIWQGGAAALEAWLSPAAGVLLACVTAAPALLVLRERVTQLKLTEQRGLFLSRSKDLIALGRVRRWQIDPQLLGGAGEVEAVALAGLSADNLLQLAEALLSDEPGPELTSIREAVNKKGLEHIHGAALKKTQSVYHGTAEGNRWYMGPQRALESEEGVEVDPTMEGPISFLRDKGMITWLIGRPVEGIMGAIGILLSAESDAQRVAQQLSATVMPGLPDATRQALAKAAAITCDGPPVDRRDGTLLSASSPPPSSGLRVRVMPQSVDTTLNRDSAPRIFEPSIGHFGAIVRTVRERSRRAKVRMLAVTVLPAVVATLLAYVGLMVPTVGCVIAAGALFYATRTPAIEAEASIESKSEDAPEVKAVS